MPRISLSTFWKARSISTHLAHLLPATRTIEAARAELRWIKEHVEAQFPLRSDRHARKAGQLRGAPPIREEMRRLCRRRSRGEPLQYILGSQPFGELDIKCKPGVLIPRQETEASIHYLATRLEDFLSCHSNLGVPEKRPSRQLSILDFCTGTGCIPLLLAYLCAAKLKSPDTLISNLNPIPTSPNSSKVLEHGTSSKDSRVSACGVDCSEYAISLAQQNYQRNFNLFSPRKISFHTVQASVFTEDNLMQETVDIVTANPPYISSGEFARTTARGVRNWEPRLALVPERSHIPVEMRKKYAQHGIADIFYARILDIVSAQSIKPRAIFFEVGDLAQALRVVRMIRDAGKWEEAEIEIWRDAPDIEPTENEAKVECVRGRSIPILGIGEGRSVFIKSW